MKKTALLFAGQGAQVVGMGRDLWERFECCRSRYSRANAVLGRDIQSICFSGPETLLTQTDNAQPAIYLTSIVCLDVLRAQLPRLDFAAAAGLSLGEFAALTAAEALSFEDGLRLLQQRGRFMQEASDAIRGSMASVIGMDDAALAEVCREADVDIANLNCPGQTVISGAEEKLARAIELARLRGAKRVIPLQVAGAYHSRLMGLAQEKLAPILEQVTLRQPTVTVVHNVTARPATTVEEIRQLLVRQVTSPVRWADSMRWLIEQRYTRFIELGPGNVLSGLMKRINKDVEVLNVADCASLEATVARLRV